MNQIGKILKFELKNYLVNKVFLGVTLFLVAVIVGIMFFPRISQAIRGGESDGGSDVGGSASQADGNSDVSGADGETNGGNQGTVLLLAVDSPEHAEAVREAFAEAFGNYQVRLTDAGLDGIQDQIAAGEAECAFVLDSLTSYTYYVNDLSMYDDNTMLADEVLRGVCQVNEMVSGGLSPEDAWAILHVEITHETFNIGKDQMQNFFYTYVMIFALYMVILLYGQMVAGNVAAEKSSRAMELLITSAKPVSMMFGKVIASCLAGLIQLVVVFGSALVCYQINEPYWGGNLIIASIFNMPVELFLYMLVFFILGFLIYAFLYGAIGSTVSKLEDINTAVMPVTMFFIIAFVVVMISLGSGTVDNLLIKVCSYIPLTSPMAMFTRIAMSTVPFYQIAISIVILIGSAVGIGVLAAKIYRVGVLLYGTRPKLGALVKAIKKA